MIRTLCYDVPAQFGMHVWDLTLHVSLGLLLGHAQSDGPHMLLLSRLSTLEVEAVAEAVRG